MKARFVMAAMMAAAMASCSKDGEAVMEYQKVRFNIDGLAVDVTPMTRATLESEKLTSVEVYDGGVLIASQSSADDDFGSPELTLSYGVHDLVFVAHRSEGASYSSPVWSATKVRGTFAKKVSLTVGTTTGAQTIELERKVYQLKVLMTDMVPATATTADVTLSTYYGGISFADWSGQGMASRTTTFDITTLQGKTGQSISMYGFCAKDGVEYTSDFSITFKTSTGTTIQQHEKANIPLQTNYITTLKGNFFETGSTFSISVDSEWSGEKEIDL